MKSDLAHLQIEFEAGGSGVTKTQTGVTGVRAVRGVS